MPDTPDANSHDRATALTALMPDLIRTARFLTRDRIAADDLMQEALLRVWARLAAKGDIDDLRPYLMTTLRNLARRPARAFAEFDERDAPAATGDAPRRLIAADVLRAIETLPPEQSRILTLAAGGTPHYADLARELDVPLGTVMSRLSRARSRLREILDLPDDDAVAALLDAQ